MEENLLPREHADLFKVQVAEMIDLVKANPGGALEMIKDNIQGEISLDLNAR